MTGTPSRAALAAGNGSARVAALPRPARRDQQPAAGRRRRRPHRHRAELRPALRHRDRGARDRRHRRGHRPAAAAGITGSGLVRASSTVKNARTSSARAANRRSHPRTVDAGRPSTAAIVRCPAPAAAASSAAPITAPASARFTAGWERGASLRLRQGDATALDEYDQYGRIRGAPPDQAMDQAVHAYVASYLDGRDVLLMAADWARCRELCARIRGDLIDLGLVDNGRTIRITGGVQASAGDLIICRRNDHSIEAGEPGRALANGDVLRIEAITPGGIMVRRRLDPEIATGQRRFTGRAFCYPGYQSADLAYAITGHSAQGATVHTGIALVTGTEDRQWLYPAMTRGTDTNLAFVFTTPARPADPQPGSRAAPELSRYDRTRPEHDRYPPGLAATAERGSLDRPEPVAVLADVLGRDGAELSATQTKRRNLANADHLGILHAIWTAETTGARDDRYRALVLAALPPGHRQDLSRRAGGCSALCALPNWPDWIPPRSSAPPLLPATWPVPGTSPPSWTPGSAHVPTRCCPSRRAPGPAGSRGCLSSHVRPIWPKSPP